MKKSIKMSLLVVLILIIACTVVVLWSPWKKQQSASSQSSLVSSSYSAPLSSAPESLSSSESSALPESSAADSDSSLASGLNPEDQPDSPDLNFKPSGVSYDDIMINVLTCLLSRDMSSFASYVGSQGLRLSPTGSMTEQDIVLSADEVAEFFQLDSKIYGTYPGSGETIRCTPEEYYTRYLAPSDFNFSAATTAYNDAADLETAAGFVSNPKTVSYEYSPSAMEWMRLIMVYANDGDRGDVLCGIVYLDLTTD